MTKESVFQEFFSDTWQAGTGLTRLDPYPNDSAVSATGVETVRNENGILFYALFMMTAHLVGVDINERRSHFEFVVESLVRKPFRGLFNRQPFGDKRPNRLEAHDNYAAIAGLGSLFNLRYAEEILSYGATHGYNYNNCDPDTLLVSQQRQPGELAFYALCAGWTPPIWEMLAFVGGVIVNAFKGPDKFGETQLCWLRLYAVSKNKFRSKTDQYIFNAAVAVWKYRKTKLYGSLKNVFDNYFITKPLVHPIRKMAAYVPAGEWGF